MTKKETEFKMRDLLKKAFPYIKIKKIKFKWKNEK